MQAFIEKFCFSSRNVKQEPPFIATKKNEDGTVSLQGYSVDLMNELSRILKFTYEMYPAPDGFYGTVTENGTWNGMIGEILNGVMVINLFFNKYWRSSFLA